MECAKMALKAKASKSSQMTNQVRQWDFTSAPDHYRLPRFTADEQGRWCIPFAPYIGDVMVVAQKVKG
jgi:phage terminase large subunit GpA-like protein